MANLRTAPLLRDEAAVRRHLRMSELLPAMEQALQDFSAGKVVQPARGVMAIEPAGGHLFWMPARSKALGVKIVTLYPSNAGRGLPTHMATILLLEPATGAPLAIMDGRLITEMRTAAVSAVATRLLSSADARVLAILGSGVQARSHYQALALVRSFAEVRIWSPTLLHAQRFADDIGAMATTAERTVEGADVVVTATNAQAQAPILRGSWLKRGCHVNAIGAPRPQWRELDDAAMANVLYVDSRAGALKESGDVILSSAPIYAEIGEALAAKVPSRAGETTVFKSLGMAVEDLAAAMLVYQGAVAEAVAAQ